MTPLTVYRWELPVDAAESRRPRGRVAARLAARAGASPLTTPPGGAPPGPSGPALDAVDGAALLPLLDRLATGDLRAAETELLGLLASGRLSSLPARALAAQALARIALLARADVGGAFTTLMPLLPELPRLPATVQFELQVTAALLFSWPDGRFLDAGRTNAYVAGAERLLPGLGTPDARCLLAIARFTAALLQEDAERATEALTLATELLPALASPVHRTLVLEAQAQAAAQTGRFATAAQLYQQVLDAAAVPLSCFRALGYLATTAVQDGRAPREVLALIERARELARRERLQPGHHTVVLDDAAGTALARLGRFADAGRVLEQALDLADEVRWTPAWPAMGLALLHVWAGRPGALRALGSRLAGHAGVVAPGAVHALGRLLPLAAALLDGTGDRADGVDALVQEVEAFEQAVPWHNLRGQVLLLAALLAEHAGTPAQAARALARAERHFQRAPSIWAGAMLRRARGAALARQGLGREARPLLDSATGTLALAEDVPNATLARLQLAQLGAALGEPGAAEQAGRHRAALVELGYAFGLDDLAALPHVGAPRHRAATAGDGGGLDALVVPIQRLAARGLSPALIRRELVAVTAELLACDPTETAVCLEEVDSAGRPTPLLRAGPESAAATEWVELADGSGRRLRLGVGGPGVGGDARARLAVLAVIAEQALELALLRGLAAAPPAVAPPADGGEPPELPGFISVSPPMRRLQHDIVRLSRSRATVIITGESGAGKEVVARAIHDLSTRAGRPYVAFNCAAVPRELFEGQLFGYRKGAFTGATADHPGVLRAADGGTVLLDEIGELPLDVQPKLLRFLETGEILPLGERRPRVLDVRVLAATFRDLEQLVRERLFREDLYYRLQVVPLHVPPLRERPDDTLALARHFVRRFTPEGVDPPVLGPDALTALRAYRWPGNVRELRNVIERALAFAPLPAVLGADHLRLGG